MGPLPVLLFNRAVIGTCGWGVGYSPVGTRRNERPTRPKLTKLSPSPIDRLPITGGGGAGGDPQARHEDLHLRGRQGRAAHQVRGGDQGQRR